MLNSLNFKQSRESSQKKCKIDNKQIENTL